MAGGAVQVPPWSWAYVTFRFGDGASNALIPLAIVLHYDMPLWALAATTAAMNLAGVPGAFLWSKAMDRSARRRHLAMLGFAVAALSMAALATLPSYWLFALAAILYTFFGVATSPAASILILQGVNKRDWSTATGTLSRRTGLAFVAGMTSSIVLVWLADRGSLGLGQVPFSAVFAAAAIFAAGAALLSARTIPHREVPLPHEAADDLGVVRETQRQFERPVFFPARFAGRFSLHGLRDSLTASHRLWPLGYTLTFMGSVAFFSSYPGVLSRELALAAGVVLLCQSPSHVVTPITYPWAGRRGSRNGNARGVVEGAALRLVALPVLCLLVLAADGPLSLDVAVPLLVVLHGVMGLSFALIQVNGPVLLAQSHPRGRGHGVGTYHAAVGLGTMLGSLTAFVLLRTFGHFWVSYVFAVTVGTIGCLTLFAAHRRSRTADEGSGSVRPT